MLSRILTCLAVFTLTACQEPSRSLEIVAAAELLQQPYPMNYPSTAPQPNAVIETLQPQTLEIISDSYGKDYHVFKVKSRAGNTGYVIDDQSVEEVHSK